jgi:biotin synthase
VLRGLRLLLAIGEISSADLHLSFAGPGADGGRGPAAADAGAARFSIVTSGRGIVSTQEQEVILATVAAIRETVDIKVCASLGLVDPPFLADLKDAGLYRFHHNLETAGSFFPEICTTHTFAARLATVEAAQDAGLSVCVGGILGMGESLAQRWELAQAIKELDPDAIPLNFLHPLPGTRLAHRPKLSPLEALKIIAAFRLTFPDKTIIICGGRQPTLRSLAPLMFAAGANALMTGDYLTTKGRLPEDDRLMLEDLGLELESEGGGGGQRLRTAPSVQSLIRER